MPRTYTVKVKFSQSSELVVNSVTSFELSKDIGSFQTALEFQVFEKPNTLRGIGLKGFPIHIEIDEE